MTKGEGKGEIVDLKGLLARDEDFVRAAVEALVQAALEAEMTEAIGAAKGERSETRVSYRSGYYSRSLITRVGTLELRVPQDRMGRFSTELFERYQRSEKALVGTLAEMYVQGVSTRKVKAVTEALCGHSFSASSISAINKSLDAGLLAGSRISMINTVSLPGKLHTGLPPLKATFSSLPMIRYWACDAAAKLIAAASMAAAKILGMVSSFGRSVPVRENMPCPVWG
jgi:hypothetical protein